MKSACTLSAVVAAAGLPVRNGSISTRTPSLSSSKQACPSQHNRVAMINLRCFSREMLRYVAARFQRAATCGLAFPTTAQPLDKDSNILRQLGGPAHALAGGGMLETQKRRVQGHARDAAAVGQRLAVQRTIV